MANNPSFNGVVKTEGVNGSNGVNGPDNSQPRTLYVGNLHPSVSEDLLVSIFSPMGQITGCKIIHDSPGSDPYAFIDFADYNSASAALMTMNKRQCLGREIRVNWATSPGSAGVKTDTSRHHHIFVGDISPEISDKQLRDAFAPFGDISDCRVVRDPQTLKSKGYGFVSFVKKHEAENAIQTMSGQWLGSRAIRTNWATRKPPGSRANGAQEPYAHPSGKGNQTFDEIYQQSSPTNCTVYCGGIIQGLSEEVIQQTFSVFGQILEIRVFKEKGYAFIKFSNKEAATAAICQLNQTEVLGQPIKCSWGKESGDPNNQAVAMAAGNPLALSYPAFPYHGMGYFYQGYHAQPGQFPIQQQPAFPPSAPYGGQYFSGVNPVALMAFQAQAAVGQHQQSQGQPSGHPQHHGHVAGASTSGNQHSSHHQTMGPSLQQQAMMGGYMQPYSAQ